MITDVLNADYIRKGLGVTADVKCFDCVSSTNNLLKEAVRKEGLNTTLFVSDCQTAGRGRADRIFFSPKGSGVYLSILMPLSKSPTKAEYVTMYAAVAAVKAVKEVFGLNVGVKWVNDLYKDNKKCAGILCEKVIGADGNDYIIVGIGVNVYMPDTGFGELESIACAITENKQTNGRNDFVIHFTNAFFALKHTDCQNVIDEYSALSIMAGKSVDIIVNGTVRHAICNRVLTDGRLQVTLSDGTKEILSSGEVRLVFK